MFLIILFVLFLFLSGCNPRSASPPLSPSAITAQPLGNTLAPTASFPLASPSPVATLHVPSTAAPSLTPEPVSSPSPGLEIPAPLIENSEGHQPANRASPTPALATPSPTPVFSVPLNTEVPESYKGKKNPYTWNDAKTKELGKAIFMDYCQGCHGQAGNIQKTADFTSPGMSSRIKDQPDYFFWIVSEGKKTASGFNMPAFKVLLKEEELWRVIIYIQDLGSR